MANTNLGRHREKRDIGQTPEASCQGAKVRKIVSHRVV